MSSENLNITVVSDKEDFQKLREPWNRLAEANGNYTPWFCWEWFDLCLRHGEQGNLFVLTVRRGGEIVAIAPLMVRKERYKGLVPARTVSFIGGNRSPLKGIVLGKKDDVLQCMADNIVLEYLQKKFRAWDIFQLDPISASSVEEGNFPNLLRSMGLTFRKHVSCMNRYCDVADISYQSYFEMLPQSTQKDIRYCWRRLEKSGSVKSQIISGGESLDQYLDLYDTVRSRSWKAPEKDKYFNRDLMHLAANKGWLRLGFLYFNGVPIAAQKWFISNNTAYIYDVLYDDEYKKHSPGKLLSTILFKNAIDNDHVFFIDYLRGSESYKEEWTPLLRERHGIVTYNRTFRGSLLATINQKVVPFVKKWQQHCGASSQ